MLKVKLNMSSDHTKPFLVLMTQKSIPGESLPSTIPFSVVPTQSETSHGVCFLFPIVTSKHKAVPGSPEWTEPSSSWPKPVCWGSGPCHPRPEWRAGCSLRKVQWWFRWIPRCWHWDGRPSTGGCGGGYLEVTLASLLWWIVHPRGRFGK